MDLPMKIFIAGATGAIGKRLVPLLLASNHQVIANHAVAGEIAVVVAARRETGPHERPRPRGGHAGGDGREPRRDRAPDDRLSAVRSLKNFDAEFALTNRLRDEGTEICWRRRRRRRAALRRAELRRLAERAQGRTHQDRGRFARPKSAPAMTQTLAAIRIAGGIGITGAGSHGNCPALRQLLRSRDFHCFQRRNSGTGAERRLPIIGNGAGIWSFVHVDDAARATALALEHAVGGIFNIVDDEPAEVSIWLPELARDGRSQTATAIAGVAGSLAGW